MILVRIVSRVIILDVYLAAPPEYENVIAEIIYERLIWAQVIYDPQTQKFSIVIGLIPGEENALRFPLDELTSALTRARALLTEFYGLDKKSQ